MKKEFVRELEILAKKDKNVVFLTGDLGFNAFESIRDSLGKRFINAGVAEQNMVSVAAGLAFTGLRPWVYSISTFLTLKTVEQVRNDICHLHLPVKMVGFGGGYGYGILGESHHLLEDLAIYSALPNMKIYVPSFVEDIPEVVQKMYRDSSPNYLRLNLAPKTFIKLPKYSGVRHVRKGYKLTIVVLGALVHNVLSALTKLNEKNVVDVFCISELPLLSIEKIFRSLKTTQKLLVVEEHSGTGGLGEKIFTSLGKMSMNTDRFIHLYAKGYPSGLFGDHNFHQKENELDASGILRNIKKLLK